ncbi:transaldolase 2, partial [Escherichia coli FDA504]
QKRAFF